MSIQERGRTSKKGLLRGELLDAILDMRVKDFIKNYRPPSTTYITVRKGTKLYNVLKALALGHPTVIIVVDQERRPIGYITDQHILQTFYRKSRPRSILAAFSMKQINIPIDKSIDLPVEEVMEKNPPVIRGDKYVRDVVRMMQSLSIPAVIVIDDNGRVRAVITRMFLIKAILNKLLGEPLMI